MTIPRTVDEQEQWIAAEALRIHTLWSPHTTSDRLLHLCRRAAEVQCDVLFGPFGLRPPKGVTYSRTPLDEARRRIRDVQQQRRRGTP
jgi:hypothetical protein